MMGIVRYFLAFCIVAAWTPAAPAGCHALSANIAGLVSGFGRAADDADEIARQEAIQLEKCLAASNEVCIYGEPEAIGRDSTGALGRIFCIDSGRLVEGFPGVVMFEPGTGQDLAVPCNIVSFHNSELIDFSEEALAAAYHSDWLASGGRAPKYKECVSYKKPLFLGGSEDLDNLELSDMEVYWVVASQLIQKVRGLPIGTVVRNVSIE